MAAIHGLSHKALKHFHKYPAALAIYWIYVSRLNNEGVAYPSLNGLVKDTGYAKPTCQKARAWLVECKALERVDDYIRREWRDLDAKDKKRKLDLDKSEYYRPTGYIEVDGERFSLLYYGALEKSEVDYTNDGSSSEPSHDGSPGRPSTPLTVNQIDQNLIPLSTELDSNKEQAPAAQDAPPPVPEPPLSVLPKVATQQQYCDAIVKTLGKNWKDLSGTEQGQVKRAAKVLRTCTPPFPVEDVPELDKECKRRGWKNYGAIGLTKVVSDVRARKKPAALTKPEVVESVPLDINSFRQTPAAQEVTDDLSA